jgi:hypothetical protein
LPRVQNFQEKEIISAEVTSEAFLSIFHHLKATDLQGGPQTKL